MTSSSLAMVDTMADAMVNAMVDTMVDAMADAPHPVKHKCFPPLKRAINILRIRTYIRLSYTSSTRRYLKRERRKKRKNKDQLKNSSKLIIVRLV